MKKSSIGYLDIHRYVKFNNTLLKIESYNGDTFNLSIYVQVDDASIIKYEYYMTAYEYTNFFDVIMLDAKREIRKLL